jgi:hypothetical protein
MSTRAVTYAQHLQGPRPVGCPPCANRLVQERPTHEPEKEHSPQDCQCAHREAEIPADESTIQALALFMPDVLSRVGYLGVKPVWAL